MPADLQQPFAALEQALELLSWFDTALLCVAPNSQSDTLCQLLNARQLDAHLLLTPAPCGSATALALAATHLEQLGLDPLMLVTPARLPVSQAALLAYAVRQARPAAEAGSIVVIGVNAAQAGPLAPDARICTQGHRHDGCHRVRGLDLGDHKTGELSEPGSVLHTAGMYLARASAWHHAFTAHASVTWQGASEAMAQTRPAPPTHPGLSIFYPDTDCLAALHTPSLEHSLLRHLTDLAAITLPPGPVCPIQMRIT